MELEEKVKAVEAVFAKLDEEIATFQSWSTLHCKAGCGKCCFKPDIEASALEFLPFALHAYRQNEAFEWLDKLKGNEFELCLFLHPTRGGAGLCSQYHYRGLVCRLFGYAARTNKYAKPELVTCQIIKTEQAGAYNKTVEGINNGKAIPVMSQYYMQLQAIDFDLTRELYPINKAITKALETVLHYYAYR